MRLAPRPLVFAAGLSLAAISAPALAWGQVAPQPVPYPTAPPPVPYGQPAPPPAPPPPGVAANAGQDVIFLKNGGVLRGSIIDAIPDAQARIQLATGEVATVAWPAIARIEYGKAAAPRPPPPVTVPGPDGLPTTATGPTVLVHVEGAEDGEVQIEHGDGEWVTVCTGHCERALPAGRRYRVAGGGMRASRPFQLEGGAGSRINVTVSPASTAWFVTGIVLIPVGGLTMLVGGLVGLVGDAVGDSSASSSGGIAFLVGVAGLVGGIVLVVSNGRSSVTQEVSAAQARLLLQGDAWKRVPAWRDRAAEGPVLPRAIGMPVWTGSF